MNARVLCAVGAAFGVAGVASAQLSATASSGAAGNPHIAPEGSAVYSNPYDGVSTFGNAAQVFEAAFSGYDIWLGDDFSTSTGYNNLDIALVGFCGNGCVDPFMVQDFFGRIYDGLPNDAGSTLTAESDDFGFNGIDTWNAAFDASDCIAAGDWVYVVAARNDFGTNGQTYFFQQTKGGGEDDGFQWNPNGAFGFPNDLQIITEADGITPSSPNTVITGDEADCGGDPCDVADCNGDGNFNILDFVCYQGAFQSGDPGADCNGDGNLNILDFVCFQGLFQDCAG